MPRIKRKRRAYNPRNGAEVKVPSGRPPESPHSSHILVSLSLKYVSLHSAHSGPSCPSRQYALKSVPPRHASGHEVAEFLHSRIPLTSNFEPGEELGFTYYRDQNGLDGLV